MAYPHIAILRTWLLVLGLVFWACAALAQEPINYEDWTRTANRAETTIETGRASDQALEVLRRDLAAWRESFLSAQSQNSERIDTLRQQIAALGPAPDTEAGEQPESTDVAARRAELNEQLSRLRAPVVSAEEAYTRADGLIREIDNLIRERRTNRLLELGPTPLNPAHWTETGQALLQTLGEIVDETSTAWESPVERRQLYSNLPVVLLLLVLGLVLIARGRRWVTRLVNFLRSRTRPGSEVSSFIASLGQIVVPLAGLLLLTIAAQLTGLIGIHGQPLIEHLAGWGATILLTWWVGERVFSRSDRTAAFQLEPARRKEARFYSIVIGIGLVAHDLIGTASISGSYSSNVTNVLELPVLVLVGLTLFRMGQILSSVNPNTDEETEQVFGMRLMWLVGKAAMLIGVVGPVMGAIGYSAAATALVYPAVSSLLLFALLVVFQRLFYEIYFLITGERDAETGGLIPVLMGFALSLAALPVLALIWGARVADLTELWARFQEGFAVGDSRISPVDFLTFVIVFMLGYLATRLVQGALRSVVLPKTRIDAGGQTALLSGISYVGIFLAGLIAITSAGIDLTALGYVAGALSVGIGFGLQNIVSNFVSGIILLIERPISKGDWIAVGSQMGYVRDISVRSTRIETFDRTDVIVPNSDLISGTVTNYTRGNTIGRVIVGIGVAYGTDTRKVEAVLTEIANSHPMVLANPAPFIAFKEFGADSMNFEIRAILRDVNWVLAVQTEMNHLIAKRFAEEGIEIPFAQRDVWLRNPEALRGGDATPANSAPDDTDPPEAPETPDSPEVPR